MHNESRLNPDTLLKYAQSQELSLSRGKLKIFLGYSAGVGKTYAMLQMVHRIKQDGVDVVIGYVESHKRPETQALLQGHEIIPKKNLEYRGATLAEMDIDAILKRKPALAVVDELAHTNVPGSRHTKRYQDIEELLAAGIDVYTTLNIQHLESLNDVITKVTGVAMQETVPDKIFDEADEIEVVDLPIGELLRRLREGKIYVPDQAERAIANFFNENNLASLRELTLRRAAKRIGNRPRVPMGNRRSASEKIIVCVTSYPSSAELVRAAKLLAEGLDAEWTAVYVETIGRRALTQKEQDQLTHTMDLAQELGAKAVILSGKNISEELVAYAQSHQITKILIGKPLNRTIKDVLFGSVVDQLIRSSGDIDVQVVSRLSEAVKKVSLGKEQQPFALSAYLISIVLVLCATLISTVARGYLEPANLLMFYLLAVVTSSIFLGKGPSVLASFSSVLLFDFFFVPPYLTFAVADTQYFFTFFVFLFVALVISDLASRFKNQVQSARSREAYATSLYNLSKDFAAATNSQAIIGSISKHIQESLMADVTIFLRQGQSLNVSFKGSGVPVNEHESAVADWVLKNGEAAGWSTDTIPGALGYYLPMKTAQSTIGVLGVYFQSKVLKLTLERKRLLEAFASQGALAVERVWFSEEAHENKILQEREKLQSALFNSISHDLRTPLVSITGSLSGMMQHPQMDEAARKDLIENAYEEAERLNRLVGNLLDMARLEANALKIVPSPCEIGDVIGAALKELEERLEDRRVTVNIQKDLPHIPMDFSLMMKVLVNLLDNAIKYAPFGLPIDVEAISDNKNIEIRILDRGLGIPKEDLEQIFDKFYRVKRPQNFEGTGLGLSICRGIVEAHKGSIRAQNRDGGGTIVTISLPISS